VDVRVLLQHVQRHLTNEVNALPLLHPVREEHLDAVAREGDDASVVMLVEEPAEGEVMPNGVFTAVELTEAINFLMRLGLVEEHQLGASESTEDESSDDPHWA